MKPNVLQTVGIVILLNIFAILVLIGLINYALLQDLKEENARVNKYQDEAKEQMLDAIAECRYLSGGMEDCVEFVLNPTGRVQ